MEKITKIETVEVAISRNGISSSGLSIQDWSKKEACY